MIIDSKEMSISLPVEKVENTVKLGQEILVKDRISLRELSKLIGKLTSTYAAVLPAPLNCKWLQMNLITEIKTQGSYEFVIQLNEAAKAELLWWIENLILQKGKQILLNLPPCMIIQSDTAKSGGWGSLPGNKNKGTMEQMGVQSAHKCTGTYSSKSSYQIIHKIQETEGHSLTNRQHSGTAVHIKNGEYQKYALAVDAMQQNWAQRRPYAFPPFSLVGRILKKVNIERVTVLLVAPVWQTQPWYPILVQM